MPSQLLQLVATQLLKKVVERTRQRKTTKRMLKRLPKLSVSERDKRKRPRRMSLSKIQMTLVRTNSAICP